VCHQDPANSEQTNQTKGKPQALEACRVGRGDHRAGHDESVSANARRQDVDDSSQSVSDKKHSWYGEGVHKSNRKVLVAVRRFPELAADEADGGHDDQNSGRKLGNDEPDVKDVPESVTGLDT
jgi:hypothetical protein